MKKLMKLLMAVIACMCVSHASDAEMINMYYKQLNNLSKEQMKIMLYSYEVGEPYDLGFSLAAIAWKESVFGKYLMNLSDGKSGAYGVYHILLDYAAKRNKVKNDWEKSRLAERLVFEIELCANEAISELIFWKTYFKRAKNPWKSMFAGYNAGGAGLTSKKGKAYAEDAILRVKALERYFANKNLKTKLKTTKK